MPQCLPQPHPLSDRLRSHQAQATAQRQLSQRQSLEEPLECDRQFAEVSIQSKICPKCSRLIKPKFQSTIGNSVLECWRWREAKASAESERPKSCWRYWMKFELFLNQSKIVVCSTWLTDKR